MRVNHGDGVSKIHAFGRSGEGMEQVLHGHCTVTKKNVDYTDMRRLFEVCCDFSRGALALLLNRVIQFIGLSQLACIWLCRLYNRPVPQ